MSDHSPSAAEALDLWIPRTPQGGAANLPRERSCFDRVNIPPVNAHTISQISNLSYVSINSTASSHLRILLSQRVLPPRLRGCVPELPRQKPNPHPRLLRKTGNPMYSQTSSTFHPLPQAPFLIMDRPAPDLPPGGESSTAKTYAATGSRRVRRVAACRFTSDARSFLCGA